MTVKTTKSGHTIATGPDYTALRERVYRKQKGRCADCGKRKLIEEMELHHTEKRGGGKRDDIPAKTKMLCGFCHHVRHGQAK